MWSGLATGVLLAVAAVYLAAFALSGGLQTSLATDAPPAWALAQFEVLSTIVALYLLAAVVFTLSLAAVQFRMGPRWAVVGGLCALALGVGLLVAGSQVNQGAYATVDMLAFAAYMVATNLVGLRARQLSAVNAGVGMASGLVLPAASLVAGGLVGAGLLALAVVLYGTWVVWLALSSGLRRPAAVQAALQS